MDESRHKRDQAEAFEHYRVLLFSIAYRMTGSASEAEDLVQQEALSLAMLRLLEALSPPERAVFLLHEVFEYPFRDIGQMLSKSSTNCRQVFHRARQALEDKRARFVPEPERQRQLLLRFLAASQAGDMATLTSL